LYRPAQRATVYLQNITESHRGSQNHHRTSGKMKIIFKVTTTLACTLLTKRERLTTEQEQEDQEEEEEGGRQA
jgi:hypothetical protein